MKKSWNFKKCHFLKFNKNCLTSTVKIWKYGNLSNPFKNGTRTISFCFQIENLGRQSRNNKNTVLCGKRLQIFILLPCLMNLANIFTFLKSKAKFAFIKSLCKQIITLLLIHILMKLFTEKKFFIQNLLINNNYLRLKFFLLNCWWKN